MTLKNINVLVLLFFLIINTIKVDSEACCEKCCNDCFKKESEDINAKGSENNEGEEISEKKSKKKSNNSLQNNSFMGNNNQYDNQKDNSSLLNNSKNNFFIENNPDNNQNNFQNNFFIENNLNNNLNNNLLPQNNLQNNVFQNKRVTTGETLGLANVGATCYMNATLQCLFHIKELSYYFLSWYFYYYKSYWWNPLLLYIDFFKKKPLFAQYMNLLCQVFYPEFNGNLNKDYAPQAFKDTISALNPLFQGIQANDAKDLLHFILETIHLEIRQASQNPVDYTVDQRDQQAVLQNFRDTYISQNNSKVCETCYAIQEDTYTCPICKTKTYNYQSYNLLYFFLKDVKNFVLQKKRQEDPNFDGTNYVLNLEDCFVYNEKPKYYDSFHCNSCGNDVNMKNQPVLYTVPTVLSIVLQRGKANQDFTEDFSFGTELDIKKYIHDQPYKQYGKYYLIGMVVHSGEHGMLGHFIAYCRMDKKTDWYLYNDGLVDKVDNIEEKLNKNKPYILFYHYDNDV